MTANDDAAAIGSSASGSRIATAWCTALQRRAAGERAVDQPAGRAPDRPHGEQHAGQLRGADRVAEGRDRDLADPDPDPGRAARSAPCCARPARRARPSGRRARASCSGRHARDGGSAVNSSVPAITLAAETISAACGATTRGQQAGQQRAEDEDQLDQHRVQRVGGLQQVAAGRAAASATSSAAPTRSAGSRSRPGGRSSTSTAVGAPSSAPVTSSAERRRVHERERRQHAALAEAVDEPALDRRADAGAGGERARHHAGDRERARALAQVEDHRERVDADREARQQRRADERGHVRHAQDLRVAPHALRARAARTSTSSIIAGGQPAGERVLLARVEAAEQRASPAASSAPWPNAGRGRGAGPPSSAGVAARPPRRSAPRQTHHARRARAAPARAPASARSARARSGSGLLAGGAQRTAAVMKQSRSSRPSSSATDSAGWRSRRGAARRTGSRRSGRR